MVRKSSIAITAIEINKSFESITDAANWLKAREYKHLGNRTIWGNLNNYLNQGRVDKLYGYTWKFGQEFGDEFKQVESNGSFVQTKLIQFKPSDSLEETAKKLGIPTSMKLDKYTITKGQVKNDGTESWWIKYWASPIDQNEWNKERIEKINKIILGLKKPRLKINKNRVLKSSKLIEIPLMDFHFGKMAWHGETGENFDHTIAEERFQKVVEKTLSLPTPKKYLVIIGNDLLNFDNKHQLTTHGTPQDGDLRFWKVVENVIVLLKDFVTLLVKKSKVDILFVRGNHDEYSSLWITKIIKNYFTNNKNVFVNDEPIKRKYYLWGKVLIGFSHGEMEKERIQHIMQHEKPNEWAKSKIRTWHLGHIHYKKEIEKAGIIIKNLSAASGVDLWHYDSGYIANQKATQIFIWDENAKENEEITLYF